MIQKTSTFRCRAIVARVILAVLKVSSVQLIFVVIVLRITEETPDAVVVNVMALPPSSKRSNDDDEVELK